MHFDVLVCAMLQGTCISQDSLGNGTDRVNTYIHRCIHAGFIRVADRLCSI